MYLTGCIIHKECSVYCCCVIAVNCMSWNNAFVSRSELTGTSSKLPGILKTHLGRGWTPAEPKWGAPPSDGRRAGAGWSPHWCTRCSHHARRTWRRRTGAHCVVEGEKKIRAEMSHLGSHCFNMHMWKEIWLSLNNSNRVWGGEVMAVGEKKRSIPESPIHVPVHRERKALAGRRKVERECDHKILCISLSKGCSGIFRLTHILLQREGILTGKKNQEIRTKGVIMELLMSAATGHPMMCWTAVYSDITTDNNLLHLPTIMLNTEVNP